MTDTTKTSATEPCPCCANGKCSCPPCQDGECVCPCCKNGNCPCPPNCPNCDCC